MIISREATVKMKAVAKFSLSFLVLVSVIFGESNVFPNFLFFVCELY